MYSACICIVYMGRILARRRERNLMRLSPEIGKINAKCREELIYILFLLINSRVLLRVKLMKNNSNNS